MMNKAELIKGINLTVEGLYAIRDALSAGDTTATNPDTETKTAAPAVETSTPASGGTYSRSELEKMPYNKFKTLAAKLGVKCTGTRDDIMSRIEKLGVITDSGNVEPETAAQPVKKGRMTKKTAETPAEAAPADKSDKPVGGKRGLVKKTSEPAADEFDAQAKEILDTTPVEDVLAALAEANVKANRRNLADKLAYALREGLIVTDDDDGDSKEADNEPETGAEENSPATTDPAEDDDTDYHPEYDPEGFNDPADMSDERRDAIENLVDEIQTKFSEGELTMEQMADFLTSTCSQEELDLLEDSDDEDAMLAFYIEIQKRFIDDVGEKHKVEDPYELGGKDMCCGHPLKYVSKTKKYVCETCGGEYEAEE